MMGLHTMLGIDLDSVTNLIMSNYRELTENDSLGDMMSLMDTFGWDYAGRFWDGITAEEENEIIRLQFNQMYASRLHIFMAGLTGLLKAEIIND